MNRQKQRNSVPSLYPGNEGNCTFLSDTFILIKALHRNDAHNNHATKAAFKHLAIQLRIQGQFVHRYQGSHVALRELYSFDVTHEDERVEI